MAVAVNNFKIRLTLLVGTVCPCVVRVNSARKQNVPVDTANQLWQTDFTYLKITG
jgi:hypothetical protein